jgi:hypothetical protein
MAPCQGLSFSSIAGGQFSDLELSLRTVYVQAFVIDQADLNREAAFIRSEQTVRYGELSQLR